MNEFIEKLIARLEEYKKQWIDADYLDGIDEIIEIVNQLAEEHKDKVMINEQYCWQTCGATEHCKECNRLGNGYTDYYENYDFMAEEYNGGWIPCRKRLPEKSGKYLVTAKNVTGFWIMESNVFVCDYQYNEFVFQGWEDNKVIAWQPLPPAFKPKGE